MKSCSLHLRKLCLIISILIIGILTTHAKSDDFQQQINDCKTQLEKFQSQSNQTEVARYASKLAYLYWQSNNEEEAIQYFEMALKINTELGNKNAQRVINSNLGLIYTENDNYPKAIQAFDKCIEISTKSGNKEDIASDYLNSSLAYQQQGNYAEAIKKGNLGLQKSLEIGNLDISKSCYGVLGECHEKLGHSKESTENYEKYNAISKQLQKQQMDALSNRTKEVEQQVQSKEKQLKNTLDTLGEVLVINEEMQVQNVLLNKENQLKEEQKARLVEQQERLVATAKARRIQLVAMSLALLLFACVLVLIYWQFREKKKANQLLKAQYEKIEHQKQEIEHQRDIANKQTQKITDSIHYAKRIQTAVLPPEDSFKNSLKDYFILYKPKDIVSGDFYWINRKDETLIIAVADCTGHGVPGAFMSMLGVAFLNEIVNKIAINKHISTLSADEILNQLREMVISSLHQTGIVAEPKDGMDISLCIIDFENKKLQFSGANNPLFLVRNGELIQYDADKMPVSFHQKRNVPFTRHDIPLKPDDRIYLFTDGYIDQFGGDKGLKLLTKKFKELIVQVHNRPMKEQASFFEKTIEDWKGQRAQLDDILVMGIRYGAPVSSERSVAQIDWKQRTILIAEDTDINYYLLAEVLKSTQAKLIRVKDGYEAINFIKSNSVDLILMDINMPNLNGYDATREIKKLNANIPIIVQTAMQITDESDNALSAGADDYITKPIDLKIFMGKLERFLN